MPRFCSFVLLAVACADPSPGPDARPSGTTPPGTTPNETVPPGPTITSVAEVGFPILSGYSGFDVGDVNGDGVADLVQAVDLAWDAGELRVLLGPLTETHDLQYADLVVPVATEHVVEVGQLVSPTVAGDLNGDGAVDVILRAEKEDWGYLQYASGGSLVLLGPFLDGAQSDVVRLVPREGSDLIGHEASHAPVGDLDGDGRDDLAVGWPMSYVGGHVFLADLDDPDLGLPLAQARAQASTTGETTLGHRLAPIADLDGDGTTDLLVGDSATGDVHVVRTGGWSGAVDVGSLGQALHVWDPQYWNDLVLLEALDPADFDGDGTVDVVVGVQRIGQPACAVLDLATASGDIGDQGRCWSVETGAATSATALPDLDGDGLDELALAMLDGDDGTVYIFRGDQVRDGAPLEEAAVQLAGIVYEARAGDVTGDGTLDLVVHSEPDGMFVVPGEALAALLARP